MDDIFIEIYKEYGESCIFDVYEIELCSKALPDKTFSLKSINCRGLKVSNERIHILSGCNFSGDVKVKSMVHGKFMNQRCVKRIKNYQ